jgi:hypothetical protein
VSEAKADLLERESPLHGNDKAALCAIAARRRLLVADLYRPHTHVGRVLAVQLGGNLWRIVSMRSGTLSPTTFEQFLALFHRPPERQLFRLEPFTRDQRSLIEELRLNAPFATVVQLAYKAVTAEERNAA